MPLIMCKTCDAEADTVVISFGARKALGCADQLGTASAVQVDITY